MKGDDVRARLLASLTFLDRAIAGAYAAQRPVHYFIRAARRAAEIPEGRIGVKGLERVLRWAEYEDWQAVMRRFEGRR